MKTSDKLAKLTREREAIAAQAAALHLAEKEMRKALAAEGAARLALAFGKVDLGDVAKGDATRLAKRVQQLGLAQALERLEAK